MALTFDYKVRDRAGKLVEGQLEGDSMALVVGKLREMGYMPISVTPKAKVNLNTEISIPGLTNRVKLSEVAVATRQLATMIDSGLSVVRALSVLSSQVENKELARVLGDVRTDVERGSSLSAAVSKQPASEPRPSSIMKQKFYSQVNMECVFFFGRRFGAREARGRKA